jgi:CubicO group peptidase (beta-lactamase class C family)
VLKGGFSRATNPVGGLATTIRDLIAWARFHLGDGAGIVSSELSG